MSTLSSSFLVIFAALFPIINPPGTALMFLAITRGATRAQRKKLAKEVAIFAFVIINASLYIGAFVLALFGISVPVLRVAGGCVVAFTGWQLLNARAGDREPVTDLNPVSGGLGRRAFYPLTMPLTTGPGTIAVTIALGTGRPKEVALLTVFIAGTLLATVAIAAIIYVCYAQADRIERVLGATGSEALERFFAFILMCIGVQIFWTGFADLWASLPAR